MWRGCSGEGGAFLWLSLIVGLVWVGAGLLSSLVNFGKQREIYIVVAAIVAIVVRKNNDGNRQ